MRVIFSGAWLVPSHLLGGDLRFGALGVSPKTPREYVADFYKDWDSPALPCPDLPCLLSWAF